MVRMSSSARSCSGSASQQCLIWSSTRPTSSISCRTTRDGAVCEFQSALHRRYCSHSRFAFSTKSLYVPCPMSLIVGYRLTANEQAHFFGDRDAAVGIHPLPHGFSELGRVLVGAVRLRNARHDMRHDRVRIGHVHVVVLHPDLDLVERD